MKVKTFLEVTWNGNGFKNGAIKTVITLSHNDELDFPKLVSIVRKTGGKLKYRKKKNKIIIEHFIPINYGHLLVREGAIKP